MSAAADPAPGRVWSLIPDDVTVIFAPLPGNLRGFCDHASLTIWLRAGMRQRQRRATLWHELEHLRRGPVFAHWREREEREIEEATARALIPLPTLLDALRWTRDAHELADELNVPVGLIATRVATIRQPAERAAIEAAVREADRA